MADFKNEFSWSKSRHEIFASCPRKYYFNYYGSWNGWKYNAPERTREIYYLKKMQTRHMWIGSIVHLLIEKVLRAYRDGQKVGDYPELEALLLQRLRGEFADSRAGKWQKHKWRLLEHEYIEDVEDEEWKRSADQAVSCFKNFWESEIHQELKSLAVSDWLEIEEFSSFFVDGVKVHVVLDCSFVKDGKVFIYDWKTGRQEGDLHRLQLACYRIYAQEKWGKANEDIETGAFNLFPNTVAMYNDENFDKESSLAEIRQSIASMKSLLKNVDENSAVEEDFSATTDEMQCQNCAFRRVCPVRLTKS